MDAITAVSSEEDIPEQLKCPVCTVVPENEIYLCKNGHTVCSVCLTHLLECPQCRVSYRTGKVRNLALESLLDSIPFVCLNKEAGCKEKLGRKDMRKHKESCKFGDKTFKLCQMIGIKRCDYAVSNIKADEAVQHIKQHKNLVHQKGKGIRIDMKDFKEVLAKQNGDPFFWDPILLEFSSEGPSFLVLVKANNEGRGYTTQNISCSCIMMANPDVDAKCYSVEFTVPSSDEGVAPSLSWKTYPVELAAAKSYLEMGPMKISTAYLIENILKQQNTNCFLEVSISKVSTENGQTNIDSTQNVSVVKIETIQIRKLANFTPPNELPGPSSLAWNRTTEHVVRFDSITCDSCKICPMSDERYKCLQCLNYDLCRPCYIARKVHTKKGHIFGYISNTEKSILINEMGFWRKRAILGLKASRRMSTALASELDESGTPQCVACEADTDSGYLCLECNGTIHTVCRRCWDMRRGHLDHINAIFCNPEQYKFALGHVKNGRIQKLKDDVNKVSSSSSTI